MTRKRDVLTDMLLMSMGVAFGVMGAVILATSDERLPPIDAAMTPTTVRVQPPFARAGQWVTDPRTGARICRLTRNLYRGMTMVGAMCDEWTAGRPTEDEGTPWLRENQIHVEGTWRP